jgi:hypothetical protein
MPRVTPVRKAAETERVRRVSKGMLRRSVERGGGGGREMVSGVVVVELKAFWRRVSGAGEDIVVAVIGNNWNARTKLSARMLVFGRSGLIYVRTKVK